MKINRTKNAAKNVIYGLLYRFILSILPFIIRSLIIYELGIEYLGLNSLFTSILSVLSIAELGVGEAIVYAMYKPIAEDDDAKICALLNLYKKLYTYIGLIILAFGIMLLPFLEYLIKGSYPADVNLYILYLIFLSNTVVGYLFLGYKQSILIAFQRSDIISKISIVVTIITYVLQGGLILAFHNYYFYIILVPISTVINNYLKSNAVDRAFPSYCCKGSVPDKEAKVIKRNVIALLGTKVSSTVHHSSDSIITSMFLGLTIVAKYSNYYLIISVVTSLTAIVYSSLTAGLGNSIETESLDKNYDDFMILSFMNFWIISWFSACMLSLIQPFMRIWVGDGLVLPFSMSILFTVYFYLYQSNQIVLTYKDSAGIWYADRYRPYVTMLVNLISNIMLVQIIGIYGIIISTILSFFITIPWASFVLFRELFKKKFMEYVLFVIKHTLIAVFVCVLTYSVLNFYRLDNVWIDFISRLFICIFLPNCLLLCVNYKNKYTIAVFERIKKLVRL